MLVTILLERAKATRDCTHTQQDQVDAWASDAEHEHMACDSSTRRQHRQQHQQQGPVAG
jgi:hypothetical protein